MHEVSPGATLICPSRSEPGERTLLIIGHKRSGTSAVARLLQLLGVWMGDAADPVVIEDTQLGDALAPRFPWGAAAFALESLIAARNQRHAVWGFKMPARNRAVLRNLRRFRHPHIVYVVRDPAAVAARVSRAGKTSYARAFFATGVQQLLLFHRVRNSAVPALVVSYEKLLSNPAGVIGQLAEFCAIAADTATLQRCLEAVRPNSNDYTRAWNRTATGMGYVDRVTAHHVAGWATIDYGSAPVVVELHAGDKCIATTLADITRLDLREQRIHVSGECGFGFDLAALRTEIPDHASRLSVRIRATGFELNNSPIAVSR